MTEIVVVHLQNVSHQLIFEARDVLIRCPNFSTFTVDFCLVLRESQGNNYLVDNDKFIAEYGAPWEVASSFISQHPIESARLPSGNLALTWKTSQAKIKPSVKSDIPDYDPVIRIDLAPITKDFLKSNNLEIITGSCGSFLVYAFEASSPTQTRSCVLL